MCLTGCDDQTDNNTQNPGPAQQATISNNGGYVSGAGGTGAVNCPPGQHFQGQSTGGSGSVGGQVASGAGAQAGGGGGSVSVGCVPNR